MLTDKEITGLRGKEKVYRVSGSGGLYIEVRPDGSNYWRQAYRFAGKQKTIAHGIYPAVRLKAARRRSADVKDHLAAGIDSGQQRKVEKLITVLSLANTVQAVATAWQEHHAKR